MTLFDTNKNGKILATQSLHYDRYAGCQYFLERVDINGKCGLVCGKEVDNGWTQAKGLLEPVYSDIQVHRLSSQKAIYDRYAVIADGSPIGQFTLVLNAWVPNS